jgi:hypothetical protein
VTADVQTPERGALNPRRIGVIIALGFVILFSLVQLYISAMVIPRFGDIFRDMIGDRPLLEPTATVLKLRWILGGAACTLSLLAAILFQRRASLRYLFAILALLLLQITFTVVALFLPLIQPFSVLSSNP